MKPALDALLLQFAASAAALSGCEAVGLVADDDSAAPCCVACHGLEAGELAALRDGAGDAGLRLVTRQPLADGAALYLGRRGPGGRPAESVLSALAALAASALQLRAQVLDETRRAELELKKSQVQLEAAATLAGVGAWQVELSDPPRVVWSAQTCRIHDLEPGHQPTLDEAIAYYPEAARAELGAAMDASLKTGEPFELETPFVTAKGREIWVRSVGISQQEDGKVVRLLGAFQDVTARRRWQERLRQLYEMTPALLLSLDAGGRIGACTDRLARRLGAAREQLVGSLLADWMPEEAAARWRGEQLPALFAAPRSDSLRAQLRTRSGEIVEVLMHGALERPLEAPRALVALEDVTEVQRRGQQLRQEQMRRAEVEHEARDLAGLLQERSEMLNVLAHEVRQPLNNASAALQHALADGAGSAREREPLLRAQRVLGRVMAGVDNALAASALLGGQSPVELTDVDVDLLLAIAIGDMPPDERARIQVQRESETRTVSADLGLMRLALRNLLANALSFSPAGAPVQLQVRDEGDTLLLEVHDRGPGVALGVRPLLFQRGARGPLHERRGSHGLGLYIVRRAMELQGGRARLLHSGAGGSAFQLRLDSSGARNT